MRYSKILLLIIFLFAFISKINSGSFPGKKITDDFGNEITIEQIPQRVITLAPNLTEMIYVLGVEDKLIGNTSYCNYPEAANIVEKVGDMLTVNFEKIITLKPDLIFITVEGNNKSTYDKLLQLGFKVFISNPRNYEGIKKTFADMGKIFDKEKTAGSFVKLWDNKVNSIKSRDSGKKNEIMFLVSLKPIMLAGENTFINEFIKFTNSINITHDININYPVFNREEVIKRNPDYIFYASENPEAKDEIKNAYPEWKNLDAVKNDNVVLVNPDLFFRPGPRFIEALKIFSNSINPR
ncbi:MAG: helical backbone metal receptor [Ignavibacteria bacterium]|jgi:iron complex transport system substrate-binding protein